MEASNLLFTLAIVSVVWGVASAVMLTADLHRRGIPTSFLFLRLMFFQYVSQYRRITLEETGKVGPLFTSFVVAMNLALVCTVAGLLLR